MKGRGRIGTALLAAVLIVGFVPPVYAMELGGARELPALNTADHTAYLSGSDDGLFYPDQAMSRAELAYCLYNLMIDPPFHACTYADVDPSAWYTPAVGTLEGLGLLDIPAGGSFSPDAPVTRGAAALLLAPFAQASDLWPGAGAEEPSFSDVPADAPWAKAVAVVTRAGLFSGFPDGSFRPEEILSRAEAAAVLNHLLGREPDTFVIDGAAGQLPFFPDVPKDHWAYYEIMGASVSHTYARDIQGKECWTAFTPTSVTLSDGPRFVDGNFYQVEDGHFLRDATWNDYFYFGPDGRYTCGDPDVDAQILTILQEATTADMTREEMLRAVYNYCRDEFTYLKRTNLKMGATGWELDYAREFLRLGKGNCYGFAGLFTLLARQLGYPAHGVAGGLGSQGSPHGWVEIVIDGENYMFDPQLEWRYLHNYGLSGYNLFMMDPDHPRFTYIRC